MALLSSSVDIGFYTGPNTNQVPLNGETSLFMLKSLLKTAGWTVSACGTGTAGTPASGTTDLLSSSAIMTNARSWFCVRIPSGSRGFTFQHDATSNATVSWRIKYSPGGFATTGTQVNNTTPGPVTGSEEIILLGGGTDASPTFAALWTTVNAVYRTNMLAENEAPYPWWFGNWSLGGGQAVAQTAMVFDSLLSGSYDLTDQDPYMIYFRQASNTPFTAAGVSSITIGPVAYFRRGLTGATGSNITGLRYLDAANNITVPSGLPTNPLTNSDEIFPIPYARASANGAFGGWKGFGNLMKWTGQNRNCGDTLSINSARDHIVIANCALSWSGEVGAT